MNAFNSLETGFGAWHPIVWLAAFFVILVITYIIRSFGSKDFRKDTDQIKPFLSGCEEPDVNKVHVKASNLYWGFTETLKGYYKKVIAIHTGSISDYLLWFFGVMAIILLVGLGL